jgi:hypothetical protein
MMQAPTTPERRTSADDRRECTSAHRAAQRFLWAGVIVALGVVIGLITGCASSRSVTVYVNGGIAAQAQETSQFCYVPGATNQRANVKADGSASASQGIEHDAIANVATAGIITGGAIAAAGGFSPPAIATGAAVAGAGVLAGTMNDGPTTGTAGRP